MRSGDRLGRPGVVVRKGDPDAGGVLVVLHGRADNVVPADLSKAFAEGRPNVTLRLFDSGHELTDVLEQLWTETAMFLRFQTL